MLVVTELDQRRCEPQSDVGASCVVLRQRVEEHLVGTGRASVFGAIVDDRDSAERVPAGFVTLTRFAERYSQLVGGRIARFEHRGPSRPRPAARRACQAFRRDDP